MKCPKCGFENESGAIDCASCGIVFSKYKPPKNTPPPQKQCPYCLEHIHRDAVKCKHCCEFLTPNPARESIQQTDSARYLFKGLIDLKFNRLVTPPWTRALYGILLVLGGLLFGLTAIYAAIKAQFLVSLGAIFLYFFLLVSYRIFAEMMIIAFKIESNTRPRD